MTIQLLHLRDTQKYLDYSKLEGQLETKGKCTPGGPYACI